MHIHQIGTNVTLETWMAAIASSACIGFTSLVPWLFGWTFFENQSQRQKQLVEESDQKQRGCEQGNPSQQDGRMKYLLSFAVGAILGDIFFHLIPESYQSYLIELSDTQETAHKKVGFSIIGGIFMFFIVEMMLEKWSNSITGQDDATRDQSPQVEVTKGADVTENSIKNNNNYTSDMTLMVSQMDLNLRHPPVLELIANPSNHIPTDNNNDLLATDLNLLSKTAAQIITSKSVFISPHDHNPLQLIDQNLKLRKKSPNYDSSLENGAAVENKSDTPRPEDLKTAKTKERCIDKADSHVIDNAGYLSLIANGLDNFTHGLAIGASFLAGTKVGILTTFVIFIHEIPHEICDYAILVNSGFSRLEAVKAQSSVALFGILGTATALYVKSIETLTAKTLWILPFSAGGFLYIALVTLLPEILDRKTDLRNTIGQVICVILGISFMAAVAVI